MKNILLTLVVVSVGISSIFVLASGLDTQIQARRNNPPPPGRLSVEGHDFWIIGTGHATNYVHSPECQNPRCIKP
jgi:hypothetical protein